MSFEHYAHQMYMKYRLALAIAVIRNKPEDLSPEQYLAKLKENIERTETANQMLLTADFINDKDFDFDENDDSLLINEFNNNKPILCNAEELSLNTNYHSKTNEEAASIDLLQDFTAAILETTSNSKNVGNGNENAILNDVSTDATNSLDEVLNTLRDIDANEQRYLPEDCMLTLQNSQIVSSTSFNNFNKHANEENMTVCVDFPNNNVDFIDLVSKTDTQEMVDERMRQNVEKNVKRMKLSAVDTTKSNDLRKGDNAADSFVYKSTYDMEVDMALNDIRENQNFNSSTNIINECSANNSGHTTHESNKHAWEENRDAINKTVVNNYVNENLNKSTMYAVENATEDTILYTLRDLTQNTSHISQSQYQNIEIPQAFIHGNRHQNISEGNKENEANNVINENINLNQDLGQTPAILTVNSNEIRYITDQSGKTYALLQSIQFGKDIENGQVGIGNIKETQELHAQEVNKEHNNTNTNIEETSHKDNTKCIDMEDDFDKDLTDSEVVPFKVVKELSKIKAYLSRKERRGSTDGCSSDSGYRSDSQSSFKTARLSDDWVPQSAHCLYDYITQCPLIAVTQEIVTEISVVLGRLIDRLHEEEKYPPFLEQLLDKVDAMLCETSRGSECFENILLDKDETIQRLLLLNKSTHILKFSIEKIANILEKTHSYLTSKEDLYELTSIEEVENLRYIFYMLEIFLQMYVKNKDSASQCTQSSQDIKILKKSSITDIWKKKWNPNLNLQPKSAGSQEKGCVLTKCGEVLNKIVVDCMEGYSLVSFAALQCFNLLQN